MNPVTAPISPFDLAGRKLRTKSVAHLLQSCIIPECAFQGANLSTFLSLLFHSLYFLFVPISSTTNFDKPLKVKIFLTLFLSPEVAEKNSRPSSHNKSTKPYYFRH